jgi:acetyl-CoA carboxylase biotin carboxyl carrier protein
VSLPSQIKEGLRELLSMTGEDEVREIEVERRIFGGWRIRVSRGAVGATTIAQVAPTVATQASGQPQSSVETESAKPDDGPTIPSPMVGTFYCAPSPEAEPFVKVGDTVAVGQIVCIIEAMKIMNEIEAEVAGRVSKVLVENGTPVEYNTPLFALEPI